MMGRATHQITLKIASENPLNNTNRLFCMFFSGFFLLFNNFMVFFASILWSALEFKFIHYPRIWLVLRKKTQKALPHFEQKYFPFGVKSN